MPAENGSTSDQWVSLWLLAMACAGIFGGAIVADVARQAGFLCVQSDPSTCEGTNQLIPFVVGATVTAGLVGCGFLVTKVPSAPVEQSRTIRRWCAGIGAGLAIVLALLATLVGAGSVALGALALAAAGSGLVWLARKAAALGLLIALAAAAVMLMRAEVTALPLTAPALMLWTLATATTLLSPNASTGIRFEALHSA